MVSGGEWEDWHVMGGGGHAVVMDEISTHGCLDLHRRSAQSRVAIERKWVAGPFQRFPKGMWWQGGSFQGNDSQCTQAGFKEKPGMEWEAHPHQREGSS